MDNSTELMETGNSLNTSLPPNDVTQTVTPSTVMGFVYNTTESQSRPSTPLLNWLSESINSTGSNTVYMNVSGVETNYSSTSVYWHTVKMDNLNITCYNSCQANITTAPNLTPSVTIIDIIVAFVLSVFIISILVGNILVISSVFLFREMRTLTNMLIASLAIADLLVAIIVLPMSLHFEIMDHMWTLGSVMCDVWITSDVFCCTASILNIVAIAMDRYWLITRNVRYTHNSKFPRKRVCLGMVCTAWLLSTIISVSPLLGWRAGSEKDQYTCVISQDLGYTVFSTFGAFWFPLSIILLTYLKIFKVARKRARSRLKSQSICPSLNTSSMPTTETQNGGVSRLPRNSDSGETSPLRSTANNGQSPSNGQCQPIDESVSNTVISPTEESVCFVQDKDSMAIPNNSPNGEIANHSKKTETDNHVPFGTNKELPSVNHQQTADRPHRAPSQAGGKHSSVRSASTTFSKKSSTTSQTSFFCKKTRSRFQRLGQCRSSRMRHRNKMRSSARTLGLIIGCFVICWLPFFLVASVLPFCEVCAQKMPTFVQSITLWLGYSNSLLNPAIYAIWDKNFRRSFKKVIKCQINWSYVFYS